MSDPFVAEIRIFCGNFPPTGWAFCNGQLIPISQNTALFSLLGTTYGGDGRSTFALPDLQGRAPMFWGNGPGLSPHVIGETGGSETVTLLVSEMPLHSHSMMASPDGGSSTTPAGLLATPGASRGALAYSTAPPDVVMAPAALGLAGGSQPHNNMQPYLAVNFIIALQGIYPSRA